MHELEINIVMDKIIDDMNARGLKTIAFICENEDGEMIVLNYDDNGLVKFISESAEELVINKRLGGRMVRPIAELARKST